MLPRRFQMSARVTFILSILLVSMLTVVSAQSQAPQGQAKVDRLVM